MEYKIHDGGFNFIKVLGIILMIFSLVIIIAFVSGSIAAESDIDTALIAAIGFNSVGFITRTFFIGFLLYIIGKGLCQIASIEYYTKYTAVLLHEQKYGDVLKK